MFGDPTSPDPGFAISSLESQALKQIGEKPE